MNRLRGLGRPSARQLVAAAILVVALVVRVAYVEHTSFKPINDAGSYLTLASEIAHTGDYSNRHSPGSGAGGTRGPSAYFAPGYPYFLAIVDLLDGHTTRRGAAVHGARLSQAVLGTITVGLVGLVALEAFGSTVALIALALAAVYPVLIELSGTIVAENLLTALVLAAVWATLRVRHARRRYAWIAVAGVLTGLATLTHENAAVLVLPLGVAVLGDGRLLSLRALAGPALLLAGAVLVVVPWTIRNAVVLHTFVPVSDATGITLVGTYNGASAASHPVPYKWRLYYGIPGEHALIKQSPTLTEPELGSKLQHQALEYVGRHPFSPLAVAYDNTRRLLELEGSYAWHASYAAIGLHPGAARTGVIGFWLICVLALGGVFTPKARRAPLWIWFVPILLWLSVVVVNAETPRFREPVDPFLVMLAGCALEFVAARALALVRQRSGRAPVGRGGEATLRTGGAELVEVRERLA